MDITYTNCDDNQPHDEHELGDDGMVCVGRQYPKWTGDKELNRPYSIDAEGLCSKWGLGDGDAFDEWWWDVYDYAPPENSDDILQALIEKYLVPEIEKAGHSITLIRIGTNHNPIRIELLDGVKVDWYDPNAIHFEPNIYADLTAEQIQEMVTEIAGRNRGN